MMLTKSELKTVCINPKYRNYALWVAVFAFIPTISPLFGFDFTAELQGDYEKAVDGLLGICVLAGIFVNPSLGKGYQDEI